MLLVLVLVQTCIVITDQHTYQFVFSSWSYAGFALLLITKSHFQEVRTRLLQTLRLVYFSEITMNNFLNILSFSLLRFQGQEYLCSPSQHILQKILGKVQDNQYVLKIIILMSRNIPQGVHRVGHSGQVKSRSQLCTKNIYLIYSK